MSTPRHRACTQPRSNLDWGTGLQFSGADPARRICLCNHSQPLVSRRSQGGWEGFRARDHHGSRWLLPWVTDEGPPGEASRPLFLWGLQAIASQNICRPPWENLNMARALKKHRHPGLHSVCSPGGPGAHSFLAAAQHLTQEPSEKLSHHRISYLTPLDPGCSPKDAHFADEQTESLYHQITCPVISL